MLSGACNCGAVQFSLNTASRDIYQCHCSICRRASGVQGMAVMVVPNGDFRWDAGLDRISHWAKPGHDWETWFCGTCGSVLPGSNDPARMFVPAGLLHDQSELATAHHIFVDSRAPWHRIADDGVQHPAAFGTAQHKT